MDSVRVVPDVGSSITASSAQQQDISPWLFEDPPPQQQQASSSSTAAANKGSPSSVPLAVTPSSSSKRLPSSFASSSSVRAAASAAAAAAASSGGQMTASTSNSSSSASTASSASPAFVPGNGGRTLSSSTGGGAHNGTAGSSRSAATLNPSASTSSFASRPITPPRAAAFTSFSLSPLPRPISRDGPYTPASAASGGQHRQPYHPTSLYPHGDPSMGSAPISSFHFPHGPSPDRRNASSTTLGLESALLRPSSSASTSGVPPPPFAAGGLASASASHLPASLYSSSSSSPSATAVPASSTPSGGNSTPVLPAAATAPKRSKNPFNFLKKKGSSVFSEKKHQSPTSGSPSAGSRLLGGSGREGAHGRGPSGSHINLHSPSPDLRNHHADLPHAPSTLSLASTSGSLGTVQAASPRITSNSFSSSHASSSSGATAASGGSGSGSALQPPFSLSSMYNRLHHGHSSGHAHSHSHLHPQPPHALGLDQEHLLEPSEVAAQNPSSSKSGGGGGTHRPGRLRLGVRPRTRDKDSNATTSFSTGGAGGGGGGGPSGANGNEDDLNAFAAALGERFSGGGDGGTASAGTHQHPSGAASFPFGPATPSTEIDFSLDTNFDQIDDIVDQDAARRALAQGNSVMPDIGGEGAGGGMFGAEGGEDGFGRGMGALPLPKPLPSQIQSAADDKEAAELARAQRARSGRSTLSLETASSILGSSATSSSPLGISPRTSAGASHLMRAGSNTGTGGDAGMGPGGRGGNPTFTRHPSLEGGRARSSSVSFLETVGMGMGEGPSHMARLSSYTGGRSLGSIGDSSIEALTLPSDGDTSTTSSARNSAAAQGQSGPGSTMMGGGGAGMGMGNLVNVAGAGAHPKMIRLHSGPVVTTSSTGFGYAPGQFGLGSGVRTGMRRVSLAEGALPSATRYGKSDQSALSTLTGSLGSSSFTGGSSITTTATGLDSRASAESSSASPVAGQGKMGLHGQSLSTASAPSGSMLFDRASAGGTQLKALRELDGSVAAGAGADALERSRMAQMMSLRKGSATSAGSRRSGISPKSSFANLPGTSRDGQPANMGGWNLPSLAAGLADPSYKFPARLNSLGKQDSFSGNSSGGTYDSLGLRKASASTSAGGMSSIPSQTASSPVVQRAAQASTTSTAWMAPDSWAVQPDNSKDGPGSDDDSEESEHEGTHTAGQSAVSGKFEWSSGSGPGRRRRSSSGMSHMTNGAHGTPGPGGDGDVGNRSGTADGSLQAPGNYFHDGRWGQRKDSVGTEPGFTGSASPRRPSDIEILDTNEGEGGFGDSSIGDNVTPTSPTSIFLQQQQSQSSHAARGDHTPSISSQGGAATTYTSGRGGGGAASVSTGAAAVAVAAAGKFLHRPHRHKNARPSTAGSLHSTFRSQMGTAAMPSTLGVVPGPASGTLNENGGGGGGGLGVVDTSVGSAGPGSAHRPSVGGSSEDDSVAPYVPSVVRERENSGFTARRPNTAMSQGGVSFTGSVKPSPYCVRIHRTDGPPYTILCPLYSTAAEIRSMISKKFGNPDAGAYRLFVRDKGSERPLGPSEKPALIQKRRLEQAGYNETDSLENMGRSDLSYLLRFVYRLDSVPTFDSESFGNDEHTFQHLHLQGRNLEMVPIFLYRHADWIVSLDLSGNPMSDIPLDFIQACTNLRSIRLSNLALKRVPQSLRQSETLTYIDVSNNRIPDLSHIALDGSAELLSFKVQNNRLTELPSYFARIETLRYLNISNNRFETFPMVLCDMPFLVDLDISFNAISSLPQDIGKMVKLQRLALVGNALEALPDTISELVSLESIDVRRNLLQDVSVLFRLPNLQSLQISHNNLKNVDAEFGSRLKSLDFGQNQLTKVRIIVPAASELTVLNLTSADIDKFDESLFSQLPNLTDLVLDGNRQFSDLTESVGELRSLTRLSCNNTRLGKLPDAIGKLSKLKVLEVHNNNIKIIPASIWNCGELETLNVSANIVQSFPFPPISGSVDNGDAKTVGATGISTTSPTVQQERKGSGASFTTTPWAANGATLAPLSVSLKKLRLCDNRLTDEVFNVLSRFVCLEVLNLSFNEIYEVPSARLSKNVRLQELYLSGNSLSSIPAEDIAQLRDLQTLYINGNKLQTLPAELGQLRKLVNLDVGNNNLKYNIANWNYDWNWNSNTELRFLNLSGNKRLEIKYKTEMVNGRQKNISDFSRLTNLRLLGLMDVTFTVQSTPDESDNRRVRTSLSQINEMSYGIADTLGKHDSLSIVDVIIPHFRKKSNECLFGLFAGRGHGSLVGSRIVNHLAEWVGPRVEWEHKRMNANGDIDRAIHDVLRRAFLRLNKELADMLMSEGLRQDSETARVDDGKPAVSAAMGSSARHHWCAGASAVLAYMVDKTLFIANAGDALAVISRNRGDAHLVSSKHDPSFRDEAMRIRSAEGWVSLRGYVNDRIDVSRSFGYYHLFPIVNAAPAVSTIELTDSDEFIILANRTLWDHMSYQTAVDVARMERDDPMLAAQKLRDFAISFGAEESIMVMVISVADLFYDRQQRRAATNDLIDKHERPRFRRDLPGDRVLARLPMEIPAPIGQLALVFTDIKNSTSLWETNPGMHAAIRLHTSLLRRQLHIIGGYEVKTEGDAFMVSFPTISSAMHWCFTIQLQLLREDWPQEILECEDGKEVFDSAGELIYRGLSVRMGIHWGAPVCELDPVSNRMDYFGPIVNRAARISGAADGGQIMASKDVVAELKAVLDTFDESIETGVEGEGALASYRLLQPGISRDVVQLRRLGFGISEVGERKLKGLETPEMLYMVYPTALAGRMEEKPDAPAPQVFEPTIQLLNIDEVKQLGLLCLRLEALSAGHVFPGIGGLGLEEMVPATTPMSELASGAASSTRLSIEGTEGGALENSIHTLMPASGQSDPTFGIDPDSRRKVVEDALALHPELLVYALRDDATDEEMARILEQLTTRVHNALSTLILKRVARAQGIGMDLLTQTLLAGVLQQ